MNFESCIIELSARYAPDCYSELYKCEFKNRSRKTGESICDYTVELKRLASLAYPRYSEHFINELVRDHLLATFDKDLILRLRQLKITTLNEIVLQTVEWETFDDLEKKRDDQLPHKIKTKSGVHNIKPSSPTKERACWNCGKNGHISRFCTSFVDNSVKTGSGNTPFSRGGGETKFQQNTQNRGKNKHQNCR